MAARRALFATVLLPLLASVARAQAASGEPDLIRLVPADAYMLQYTVDDPSMDFFWDYWLEVLDAVGEARFDELVFDVIEAGGARREDVDKLRSLRDTVVSLVGSIDWEALFANEVVYAESSRPLFRGAENLPGLFNCNLMAFRVDLAQAGPLEGSIGKVMQFLSAVKPDVLAYESDPGGDPEGDPGVTRLHRMLLAGEPVVQMAVRDDTILIGAGRELFESSLALLEGRAGQPLVETERYRRAFGELSPADSPSITYMDVGSFLDGMRDQIVASEWFPKHNRTLVNVLDDMLDLVSCFESVATTTHARGSTVVVETWTRFDADQARKGNPLFLACTSAAPSNELLAFVPADALAFDLGQGADLGPLYRWVVERIEKYVPYASDYVVAWELAQALGGLDIEKELLPLLGSSSVRLTLPSRVTSQGEDEVCVVQVKDKAACQKVLGRVHAVFDVVEERVLDELMTKARDKGSAAMLPRIALRPAEGTYPGLHTFSVSLPFVPIPEVTYGMVGNYLVSTTSHQALDYVLATAAGEHAGIDEHPAFGDPGLLSEGPVVSASYAPVGRQLQKVQQVVGTVAAPMHFALQSAARGSPETTRWVETAIAGLTPRVLGVLGHLDFLQDEVTFAEVRAEGLVRYSRKSTRYVPPDERDRLR